MSAVNAAALLAAAGGDYQISRSVRLRSSASAYFSRTFGTPTNQNVWTYSGWFKLGQAMVLLSKSTGTYYEYLAVDATGTVFWVIRNAAGTVYKQTYATAQKLRDPSAWYHFVARKTASLTVDFTVNNQAVALTSGSAGTPVDAINSAVAHNIGWSFDGTSNQYSDGYLTEVNFIDGQALTPSSFGETDAVTGVWKPKKYAGTYGTNGFYLNFSDNSAATAAAIGKDSSGNGNNWTPNNISVTSGVTYDSMLDVPTLWADGGNGRGNYAVMNPLLGGVNNAVMANGNLTATLTYSSQVNTYANMPLPTTGKWYWESTVVSSNYGVSVGIRSTVNSSLIVAGSTGGYSYYNANGNKYDGATASAYGTSWYGASRTDVIGVAYDADTRELTFYLNGVSQGVAFTVTAGEYYPAASHLSGSGSHTEHYNFGQRPFAYTPPTGFKALNTQNLPDATIKKGNAYFDVSTWTGDQAARTITNSGAFQPDLIWTKSRSDAESHRLHDAVRGGNGSVLYELNSNLTEAEGTDTLVSGFAPNGFTIASGANTPNITGRTYVGWQWKESPSAGFDIVTYTGTGANTTVAHSLGVAPKMMIVKSRNGTNKSWNVWHSAMAATEFLYLEQTAAKATDATKWNSTAPSSTVFSLGSAGGTNASGENFVAYLFSEVAGFSKFGSYTGNGSADGPFVYCGFRPRWVMIKRTDSTGDWFVFDTARNTFNTMSSFLRPNWSDAEATNTNHSIDLLSNGFKSRAIDAAVNASGGTFIYAAFAEVPFKAALGR